MKVLIGIILIASVIACGTKKNKELLDTDNSKLINEIYDTLFVDGNLAVIWWPDSNDQIVMKESYDEISYNKFVDDMTWYTQKAVEMFDSMGIENKVTDKDFIVFKRQNHTDTILNRKEVNGNLVLFNVQKDPLIFSTDNYNRWQITEFYR